MFWPMSFTTTMFDDLILELGELATLRDDALRHPEIARKPAVEEAVQSLAEAVTAMTRAALVDGSAPEMALARIALSRAQRLFGPVNALLTDARADGSRNVRSVTAAGGRRRDDGDGLLRRRRLLREPRDGAVHAARQP